MLTLAAPALAAVCRTSSYGPGAATVIEPDRAPGEVQAGFAALERHPSVVSIEELGQAALPELTPDWTSAIEDGWIENVGN